MIAAVDVDYRTTEVVAAVVGFDAWTDPAPRHEAIVRTPGPPAAYEPGEFYKRELPHLRAVLAGLALDLVIVDGYVWLGPDRPGLGAHLHAAIGVPVVGVAKRRFAGAVAHAVQRGDSHAPLFVTAIGTDAATAAGHVAQMHGPHRLPTLLKRVDRLARDA